MKKFFIRLFIVLLGLGTLLGGAGALAGLYFYFRLTRDLPRIEKVSDYQPRAVSSIYARDGTLLAEVYDELRYPLSFSEIPLVVRQAFLAAEDSNFYNHPGVDVLSIFRAVWKNLQAKSSKQGASTITQQVVKALLLSREKTYERKLKEAILAYRLERALSKDDIFTIYLNEIFLGAHAYGVKAAAKMLFQKELPQLTLAQAAFLAGLPQRPSELVDPDNRREAQGRQQYVLAQMLKENMITAAEYNKALEEKTVITPGPLPSIHTAPYYASHAIQVAEDALRRIDRKLSLRSPGGFRVVTEADTKANDTASRVLQEGLRAIDKRRGWRGPLKNVKRAEETPMLQTGNLYPAVVTKINRPAATAEVRVGLFEGVVNLAEAGWAKRFRAENDEVRGIDPARTLNVGDLIEVSLDTSKERAQSITDVTRKVVLKLDQTPELEGAFVALNVLTGAVVAIVGGYDYQRSVFNRATQGMLQPGSAFKPFIYTAALDYLHYTPSTIVPDSPITLVAGNGELWSPRNFDNKFLGPMTLRTALAKSRNVVSVYLLDRLGVDRGIQMARTLGITTPIGRDMSIALGTPELKPIELVHAYGTFAAGGWLADSLVVTQIFDRHGKLIYEQTPKQKKVLSEETAFLMANMMKGVVERGTATVVKKLGKPVAGKTGTTNEHMDAWFIGYTPEWAAGVWVGFDVKRMIGRDETGGKAAAPIFLHFMEEFLADVPPLDFDIPDGVVPVAVDLATGQPLSVDAPGAFTEYFKSGTEPLLAGEAAGNSAVDRDYLSSDEF